MKILGEEQIECSYSKHSSRVAHAILVQQKCAAGMPCSEMRAFVKLPEHW